MSEPSVAKKQRNRATQPDPFMALPLPVQRLLRGQPVAQAVYVEYLRQAGPRAKAQISYAAVARAIGRSPATVKRARAVLEALGLILPLRTRRTGITWLPMHPAFDADWATYQARKAAKEAREAGGPHMEGSRQVTPPYGRVTEESRRVTDDPTGRVIYDPSIYTDVLTNVRSTYRGSVSAAAPPGPTPLIQTDPAGSPVDPRPAPDWAVTDQDQDQDQDQGRRPTVAAPRRTDLRAEQYAQTALDMRPANGSRVLPPDPPGAYWEYYDDTHYLLPGVNPRTLMAAARRSNRRFAAERAGGGL